MLLEQLYESIEKNITTYKKFHRQSKEIVIRCPFCGDSKKHYNKGHFYIGEVNGVLLYNCMRAECATSGIVNRKILDLLNIEDKELILNINKMLSSSRNKIIKSTNNSSLKFTSYNFNFFKTYFANKMDYLKRRLYNLDDIDLDKYRIILSPKNFIETFNIPLDSYQNNILDNLEHNSIGFLNMNGSGITFRYIDPNSNYRYYKLKINNDVDIYTISNKIDLNTINKVYINIAEGSFDIINISNRCSNIVDKNLDLFISANGRDFINKIEYISKYIGVINLHINIFRDSDMPKELVCKQFKNSIFRNAYSIYTNTLNKDYSYSELFVLKEH